MATIEEKREMWLSRDLLERSHMVRDIQSEVVHNFSSFLESHYSKEELEILKNVYWGVSITDVLLNVGLEYLNEIFDIAILPIEDLPLHINNDKRFIKGLVGWRLTVG
jgi:hypothetical protein